MEKKPVLIYATGAGWTTLGFASTETAARRIILKNIGDHTKSLITRHKFRLTVWERTPLQVELNGGPEGFIFDISK